IKETADDDTLPVINYPPPQPAPKWTISNNKTERELGLRILYQSPQSDCSVYFDRIYSLIQYGIDHIEKIKKEQKRMEMRYDGYLLSVLSIDTTEIKKMPLRSLGFDPNHIEVETNSKRAFWI